MKKLLVLSVLVTVCFAYLPTKADDVDGQSHQRRIRTSLTDRTLISPIGDIRAIMGTQGKNITVSAGAEAIAVIFGDPTPDPQNFMEVKIAYSTDDGATWITYGPFSGEYARIYPGVDGSPDFDENPGELFFSFQESPYGYAEGNFKTMIEEGVPAASSPSTPLSLPSASGPDLCPWHTGICAAPDNPFHLVANAFSYLNNGNDHIYAWVSEDGGYTWSDTTRVTMAIDPVSGSSGAGKCRQGTGDYVMMAFHDTVTVGSTPVAAPHHIESTDGGYTWGNWTELPVPAIFETSQFWWHELDCEVINGEPWAIHNDLEGAGLGGMWLYHGTGSPGSWTWEVWDVNDIGAESLWVAGTLFYAQPSQYPSISHDPVSGMILVSYKGNYYKGDNATWAEFNGAHIGGVYTYDNGQTWTVANILSEPQAGSIVWGDWSATEVAHRLVNRGDTIFSYAAWAHEAELNLYFERGIVRRFTGIEENSAQSVVRTQLALAPTICSDRCYATFSVSQPADVQLVLYDVTGRHIQNVYSGACEGVQKIDINTTHLTNGTYFLTLKAGNRTTTRKFIKL